MISIELTATNGWPVKVDNVEAVAEEIDVSGPRAYVYYSNGRCLSTDNTGGLVTEAYERACRAAGIDPIVRKS